jgi:hypothetical protein
MEGLNHSCLLGTGKMGIKGFDLLNARSTIPQGGKEFFLSNPNGGDHPDPSDADAIFFLHIRHVALPLFPGDRVAINENLLLLQHGKGGRVMKL